MRRTADCSLSGSHKDKHANLYIYEEEVMIQLEKDDDFDENLPFLLEYWTNFIPSGYFIIHKLWNIITAAQVWAIINLKSIKENCVWKIFMQIHFA